MDGAVGGLRGTDVPVLRGSGRIFEDPGDVALQSQGGPVGGAPGAEEQRAWLGSAHGRGPLAC